VTSTRSIGSDHVILDDERLVVISRAYMDAWQVRSFRINVIRFDNRDWYVTERTAVPPDSTRYTLSPWHSKDHDVIGLTIEYGPDYVAARDRAAMQVAQVRRVSGLLRIAAPFTGFLSARIKNRLEAKYGIDPVLSSKQSVLMQTFASIGLSGASLVVAVANLPLLPLIALVGVLVTDASVRWSCILDEERPPPGFYEWLFRLRL